MHEQKIENKCHMHRGSYIRAHVLLKLLNVKSDLNVIAFSQQVYQKMSASVMTAALKVNLWCQVQLFNSIHYLFIVRH